MSSALDDVRLAKSLDGCSFGSPLRAVATTGSTNADALSWGDEGAPEGALWVADHQTEGRGRKGRTWISEPGRGLLFSVVVRPTTPEGLSLLSAAAGVGACEAIRGLTRLSVLMKWPNDLMVGDRKLAGILVETKLAQERAPLAVIGIGLNLSWAGSPPPEIADRATSIATEMDRSNLGDPPAREEVLAHLVRGIERRYRQLERGEALEVITSSQSLSSLVGRDVVVRLPSGDAIEGMVTGLADDGGLEVQTTSGLHVLTAGEVETVRSV